MSARAWIGTSGWSYAHWEDVLYPKGLDARHRLDYYTAQFDTAELNSSFYRWQRPSSFASWRRRLPEGFSLSVKAPRGLTHSKRLYAPEAWIERIREGWHALREKRGVLLVQLSPKFERDDARLSYFLDVVPSWIRLAFEFRHSSWHCDDVLAKLESRRAAYCVMSGARLPCLLRATASFVYVRLHGPDWHHLYGGSYSDDDLRWWADRVHEWQSQGREVFVYCNNDGDGSAVRNAWRLRAFLS